MSLSRVKDIGAYIRHELGANVTVVDASSTNDGVAVGGVVFDRQSTSPGDIYQSFKGALAVRFRGSTTRTGTVDVSFQDGASSNTFTDFSTASWPAQSAFGSTGATGQQTIHRVIQWDTDISAARRYIRVAVNANHAATSSGTSGLEDFTYAGVLTFGGGKNLPAE